MARSFSKHSLLGVTCPFSFKNSIIVPARSRGLENLRTNGAQLEGFGVVIISCSREAVLPSLSHLHSRGLWSRTREFSGMISAPFTRGPWCEHISCKGPLGDSFSELLRISFSVNASISLVSPVCRSLFEAGSWFSSSGDLFLTFLCSIKSATRGVPGGSSMLKVFWLILGQNWVRFLTA